MRTVEKPRVMLILISDITLMNNPMTGTIRKGLVGLGPSSQIHDRFTVSCQSYRDSF